ncbi:hypothetical protein CP01DC11_1383, partial [Chlamydia psittaci 01DC11]
AGLVWFQPVKTALWSAFSRSGPVWSCLIRFQLI